MRAASGKGGGTGGASPAAIGPVDQLTPDEVALLRLLWAAEALPGVFSDGATAAVASDDYALAARWARARQGGTSAYVWADEATRRTVRALAVALAGNGYLDCSAPPDPRHSWERMHIAFSDGGRRAVADAVPDWWAAEGVVVPDEHVVGAPAVTPAEAVATFARILAAANSMPLAPNGRPSAANQRALLRCLPPPPPISAIPGQTEAAEDDPASADGTAPWAGFDPRLGVWLAAAAYRGLLKRDATSGGRGRWSVTGLDDWFDLAPEAQWQRLVSAWTRAASASPLAALALRPLAGRAPGAVWLVPNRLIAWMAPHLPAVTHLGPFLRDAVFGAGAALGVLRAGTVAPGCEPAFSLTESGGHAMEGRAPAAWPAPSPPVVGSDLTVVEPLAADPEAAYCLRRLAELQGVDRAVTYRLTRVAWTGVREAGDDPQALWADATAGVRQPIPQNVTFTLTHDWSDAGRSATLERVLLLRFPSEEIAALARREAVVRQALLEQVSPTAWTVDAGREAAVRRALTKMGIAAVADAGGASGEVAAAAAPRGGSGRRQTAVRVDAGPPASAFRLPWPGPFGEPAAEVAAVPLLKGGMAAVPKALVRMPPQAIYRRLRTAYRNGEEVWVELHSEGFVRFKPEQVTKKTLYGQCRGCGQKHTLDLDEIRAMLDHEALHR